MSSVLATERHAERMQRLAAPFAAAVHVVDPLLHQSAAGGPDEGGASGGGGVHWSAAGRSAMRAVGVLAEAQIKQAIEERLAAVQPGDGSLIIYTSGTTGNPKGKLVGLQSVWVNCLLCWSWSNVTGLKPTTGAANAMPLCAITCNKAPVSAVQPDMPGSKTTCPVCPPRSAGALHTHCSVMAQVHALCEAWHWAPTDRILHSLPLHHVHGVVNALYCALHAGAAVEFMPRFSPSEAWQRLMVRG